MVENRGQIILSPADFDARLANDPNFRDSIAGFSCISLYHVIKARQKQGYYVPIFSVWGQSYCELHPDVYREVFNKEPIQGFFAEKRWLAELIKENRIYGLRGAVIDFLLRQPRVPRSRRYLQQNWVPNYLTHKVFHPEDEEDDWDFEEAPSIVSRIFPDEESLNKALTEIRQRGGVQMVYGNKESFIEFLKANNPEPVDDCAAAFTARIPPTLVRAIIPLGEYEQQALLGTV